MANLASRTWHLRASPLLLHPRRAPRPGLPRLGGGLVISVPLGAPNRSWSTDSTAVSLGVGCRYADSGQLSRRNADAQPGAVPSRSQWRWLGVGVGLVTPLAPTCPRPRRPREGRPTRPARGPTPRTGLALNPQPPTRLSVTALWRRSSPCRVFRRKAGYHGIATSRGPGRNGPVVPSVRRGHPAPGACRTGQSRESPAMTKYMRRSEAPAGRCRRLQRDGGARHEMQLRSCARGARAFLMDSLAAVLWGGKHYRRADGERPTEQSIFSRPAFTRPDNDAHRR